MRDYVCATCGTTGQSYGVRPSGWGMETTLEAPSEWRRWCPPCWSKHIGLDAAGPNPFLTSRLPGRAGPMTADTTKSAHIDMIARILVGSDWDDERPYTDIGSRETVASLAEQTTTALRPVHYREAAASLRTLGHTAAAALLDATARDLEDEGHTDG